ncbi:putative RNA-binding protein [Synechococcus sp. PCC 7502]|uniref:Jag family protein n=1 Tax=Synechococcus sp. PCC 7502 TaxID=1173263 RepID=UPI00029FF5B7|nr:R3H domain-containing nucleic acid-binding protein [Synechococcus sp. PCC 7502]AFY74381.1 putative RNA-binding protein [Synechococcus sp. PCC 7502]
MGLREQSELGKKWLIQLLEILGYVCDVDITDEVNDPRRGCTLVIDHKHLLPDQVQALIGIDAVSGIKTGVTLDAIQHLANTALNAHLTPDANGFFYVVELNGYRKERQAVLTKIAEEAIAYVTENQNDYPIKNLSAAERRQVHMFFEDYPHIETFSEGKEPHRYLVVRLKSAK